MVKKIFFILIFLLYSVHAFSEADISVQAQPNPIMLDDSLQVQITISVQGRETVNKPTFNAIDFDIASQSNSIASHTSIQNGSLVYNQKYSYTYILYPKKIGLLKITEIKATVGSQVLKGDDLLIQVKKNLVTNSNDSFRYNSDFSVKVEASKKEAYVGEPIIISYYLYDNYNLRQKSVKKWPTFEGFWKDDLDVNLNFFFSPVVINGKKMRKALISKFALYPIKPGKFILPRLVVEGTYTVNYGGQRNANDPFAGFFRPTRTAVHGSQDLTLSILPLPEANRPQSFTGAVGSFQIASSIDKAIVEAHKPLTLTFKVTGIGNFEAIEEPGINFPPDFEIYETKVNVNKEKKQDPLKRFKEFTFLLIPRKSGEFTIPPIEWNFFDTNTKSFKLLKTKDLKVSVIEGKNINNSINKDTQPKVNSTVKKDLDSDELLVSKDVLSKDMSFSKTIKISFYMFLILFFVLLLFAIVKNYKAMSTLIKIKTKQKDKFKDFLIKLKNQDKTKSWQDTKQLIFEFLSIALNQNANGLTKNERLQLWLTNDYSEKLILKLETHLLNLEKKQYAKLNDKNLNTSELKTILNDLIYIIDKIRNK